MEQHYLIPDWPAPAHIKSFTTTRLKGKSQAPFDAFNLSHTVGDDFNAVQQNRECLAEELQLPHQPNWLEQVHGTRAILCGAQETYPKADAYYTNQPKQVCAVLTADCLPILVCDQQGQEVAAIHAGWKGILAGIIDSTINSLKSKPKNLLVWFGPAIGPKHFEVDDEFRLAFMAKDPQNSANFRQISTTKWLADIYGLARNNLAKCGISQIYGGDLCTVEDRQRFYSYRRDNKTGRMASLIWIDT